MEKRDYSQYLAGQLLQDDFFLESHLYPTDNNTVFWEKLMSEDKLLAKEIESARTILFSRTFRHQKLSPTSKVSLWNQIVATNYSNKKKKQNRRFLYGSVAAVASIALLFIVGNIYYSDYFVKEQLADIKLIKKPETQAGIIQLITADKTGVSIETDNSTLQYNKKGELSINSEKVKTREPVKQEKAEIIYNQLIVPAAKRSFLELSDGTKIWVNANTYLVYPVAFNGDKREIYVEGEIYLEVFPDAKRPFLVKTKKMDVHVLGTSFNVSVREADPEVSVVLVEGKVNVKVSNQAETILKPKEMFSCIGEKTEIKTVDVTNYISWKDGTYTFDDECFAVVLHKLSLYYGKEIVFDDKVAALRCSGTLNLCENLEELLKGMESTVPVFFVNESGSVKVYIKPFVNN